MSVINVLFYVTFIKSGSYQVRGEDWHKVLWAGQATCNWALCSLNSLRAWTFIGAGAGGGQQSHSHMMWIDQSEARVQVTWSAEANEQPLLHTLAQESRRRSVQVISPLNHEIVSLSNIAKWKELDINVSCYHTKILSLENNCFRKK